MKSRKPIHIKAMDESGKGLAKIATLSAVDLDGDTYAPGAFGSGQEVQVLSGHSWQGPPLGKGRIFEKDGDALAEFQLNLDTTAGADWHKALQFDVATGAKALTEWSYGFHIMDSEHETRDGKSVRVLKALDVFEVSPVVQGAGVGTGTLAIKSRNQFLPELERLVEYAEHLKEERSGEGKDMRPAWAEQIKELTARLEALVAEVEEPGEVPADADAERLLAEFLHIQSQLTARRL